MFDGLDFLWNGNICYLSLSAVLLILGILSYIEITRKRYGIVRKDLKIKPIDITLER